jgi:hypothetical protein
MELEGLERGVVQERVGRGPGVVHGNGVAGGDGGPLSVKRVLWEKSRTLSKKNNQV